MDIRIKATEYQMTPETSAYLDERVARIEKFLGESAEEARCEVEVGRAEGHHKHSEYQWFAEIQLARPGLPHLVAHNHEPTVNAAIDNATDELLRQLRQEKKTRGKIWRRGGALAKRLLRLE